MLQLIGGGNAVQVVKNVMGSIFTRKLACTINWKGSSDGTKSAFENTIIKDVVISELQLT